jgi:hypothetical protein
MGTGKAQNRKFLEGFNDRCGENTSKNVPRQEKHVEVFQNKV